MAVNVQNAFIAKPMDAGTAFSFPPGRFPAPTDAKTPLDADILAFDHGAVDENGFSVAKNPTSAKISMFGGGTFVSTQTEYEEQVKITFLEDDNINVLETVFGEANVIAESDGSKTIYHTDEELPIKSWILQARYEKKTKRYFIEFARVVEVAEAKSDHKEPTKWELTLDVFKGSTGKYVIELRADGSVVPVLPVTKVFTLDSGVTEYTVTVDGETTATISTKTAAALKSALEALTVVGSGNVTVSGSSGGPLTAEFSVAVTSVTATGTGGDVTVA